MDLATAIQIATLITIVTGGAFAIHRFLAAYNRRLTVVEVELRDHVKSCEDQNNRIEKKVNKIFDHLLNKGK
jgi:hypothetical protein